MFLLAYMRSHFVFGYFISTDPPHIYLNVRKQITACNSNGWNEEKKNKHFLCISIFFFIFCGKRMVHWSIEITKFWCVFVICAIASAAKRCKEWISKWIYRVIIISFYFVFSTCHCCCCALAKYQKHIIYSFYYFECKYEIHFYEVVFCGLPSLVDTNVLSYMFAERRKFQRCAPHHCIGIYFIYFLNLPSMPPPSLV